MKDNLDVMRVKNVSFKLRKGEILGVAGVTGNGQTELLEALSGIRQVDGGEIKLFGYTISSKNIIVGPRQLREQGVAHVPEDRQRMGLVTEFDASENLIFGYHHLQPFSKSYVMMGKNIFSHSKKIMQDYDVRPQSPLMTTSNFSGGNQQKIILSRELNKDPKVLLVGQPTRGVDIGAIEFIFVNCLNLEQTFVEYQSHKIIKLDRDYNRYTNVLPFYIIKAELFRNLPKTLKVLECRM